MPRPRPKDPPRKNDGWLVSHGDLMTTLLCFFIILSALAEDQTGLRLYQGLESFRNRPLLGLSGLTKRSERVVQLKDPSPHFQPNPVNEEELGRDAGVEGEEQKTRLIDAEEEQFQRFLLEMNRQFPVEKLPRIAGQATVDLFDPLRPKPPHLAPSHREVLAQLVSVLKSDHYRVFLVVWATMPSESAWLRATQQARQAAAEFADAAQLGPAARGRLPPVGQVWRYPDHARPVLSLIIARTVPATEGPEPR